MATFDARVEAKMDGTNWTDISGDVLYEDKISLQLGAGNQGSRADAGTCSFRLLNTNGDYTPGNPQGIYYPNIERNTAIRVSVKSGEVGLLLPEDSTGGASTPDNAALDIVGDIDVRLEASLWNWSASTSPTATNPTVELIGKYDVSPNRSWFLGTRGGKLYFEWSNDGTTVLSATATDTLHLPGSSPRMAVRVTLDVDNGAAGKTVTFYRADSITGDWEQVGAAVTTAGTTSIANSTAALKVGDATVFSFLPFAVGVIHKAEVRSGIGGSAVANPDFTIQADGATSFADAAGRTWTKSGSAEITNRKIRFSGEAASWKPGRHQRSFKYVEVEAGGILRRLDKADSVLKSAMYRDLTSPTRTNIIGYWPMEDGTDATQISTPIDGAEAMTVVGDVDLSSYSLWAASAPIPTFNTGYTWAEAPVYTVTGQTSIRFFIAPPATGVATSQQIVSIPTTGTAGQWRLILDTAGNLELRAFDATGTQIFTTGVLVFALNGARRMLILEFTQSGPDITANVVTKDVATLSTLVVGSTVAGFTFGRVNGIKLGGGGDASGMAIGQLTIADSLAAYTNTAGAIQNWYRETATDRLARLTAEEGLPFHQSGISTTQQGGQGESDIVTLMRDVEATEYGIFAESRDRSGLYYRTPDSLSSQKPVITLTYTDGASAPIVEPFEPVYDDDILVNDFTATRRDGGAMRYEETSGRLSTSSPPAGAGRYETGDTFNVAYEAQAGDVAGWAVHLGTFEGARFGELTVRLEKKTALVNTFCRVYVGDVITVTNVPLDLAGTSTVKLRVEGYREIIDQFTWQIIYVMSPAEPWDTGFAGYDNKGFQPEQFAWADTDGSTLTASLTTSSTTAGILTNRTGPVWTSDPYDTPYDLKTDGEIVRVTAPGGLVNSNPFFDVDATGWTGLHSSVVGSTAFVNPHPAAVGSLKITPTGGFTTAEAFSATTANDTVTRGADYVASAWLYSPTGWASGVTPAIDWYTNAGAFISTSSTTSTALTAQQWLFVKATFTAPATAGKAAVRVIQTGTPATTDIYYAWAVRFSRLKASAVYDNFGRTDTDTWTLSDSGNTWSNNGTAADYDVLTGFGRHTHPAASVGHHSTTTAPHADGDLYADITTAALSTGASQFAGALLRYADIDNLYEARVEFTTANAINLTVRKRVAAVETQLGSFATAFTHVAGTYMRVRFQISGSTLKARIWPATAVEPMNWNIEVTDSALTAAGSVGVKSVRNAGNTNANAIFQFDNFDLVNPQTFVIARSINSVVKAHSAGAAIALATPAVPGI
jgi:hypothetical protein